MNLGFPKRFLKKLDIYQQIRRGQGISKHKKLWKYEAAFLKIAYSGDHQFLNACPNKNMIKDWIKRVKNEYDGEALDQVIGNLIWKRYLVKNKEIEDSYNITRSGLLTGEVISELENDNVILKYWNKYRYSLMIDLFWLFIFLGVLSLFFGDELKNLFKILKEASNILILFLVFVFWPILNWLYREIYASIENRK